MASIGINPGEIIKIWDRVEGIVISYFASFSFETMAVLDNMLLVTLLSTEIFIIYMIFDQWLREYIIKELLAKNNKIIQKMMFQFMNNIYYFGIFLFVQFLIQIMRTEIEDGDLSFGEIIVTIISLIWWIAYIIQIFVELEDEKPSKKQ